MKIVNVFNGEKSIKVETDTIIAGVTYTTLKEYEENFTTNVQLIEQGVTPYVGFADHFKKYKSFIKSASSYYNEFYDDSIDEIAEDIFVIEVTFIINGEKYTELYIDDNGFDGDSDYNDFLTALDKRLQKDEIYINVENEWAPNASIMIFQANR